MYSLIFNGEFQVEYPDEFLNALQEIQEKYDVEYYGQIKTRNLGNFVDFQKIDNDDNQSEGDLNPDIQSTDKTD